MNVCAFLLHKQARPLRLSTGILMIAYLPAGDKERTVLRHFEAAQDVFAQQILPQTIPHIRLSPATVEHIRGRTD